MNVLPRNDKRPGLQEATTAVKFDRKSDTDEDVLAYVNRERTEMLQPDKPTIEVKLPLWVVVGLEKEAAENVLTGEPGLYDRITEGFAVSNLHR